MGVKLYAVGGPGCGEHFPMKKRPEALVRCADNRWRKPENCTEEEVQEGHFYLCVDDRNGRPYLCSEHLEWSNV